MRVTAPPPIPTASLAAVVCGRRIEGGASARIDTGHATVLMPRLTRVQLAAIRAHGRDALATLPLQEILAFVNRAGVKWRDAEYVRRRLYVRQLQDLLGFSEEMAEAEADRIGLLLTGHARAYDVVASELGSRWVLDDWVRREECFVRALPRGCAVQLLPGNVPVSAVVAILRCLMTKNVCVAKVAGGDPVTAVQLAGSFHDVDPEHPVSRALSVVYWEHDAPEGAALLRHADAVGAWGGRDAIEWARAHTPAETPLTCFGPKRSIALVGAAADPARAARRAAHDVSVYDQRGCFSVQRIFLEGDPAAFVAALASALDDCAALLPPASASADAAARVQLALLEEAYCGSDVIRSAQGAWTIVVGPPADGVEHPLGRTVHVHPVTSLAEAHAHVDCHVQTVALAPWELTHEHRDALARRGVARLVELGMANLLRVGGTHDGVNPLQALVRFVSVEQPHDVHGKGMVVSIDQTELLRNRALGELVL